MNLWRSLHLSPLRSCDSKRTAAYSKLYLTYGETKAKITARIGRFAASRTTVTADERVNDGNSGATGARTELPRARAWTLFRGITPLLGLRIVPPGPGKHCQEHRRRTRRLRRHAHWWRQVALLSITRRPRCHHRGRDLPVDRLDAGPGPPTPANGNLGPLVERRHSP